MPSDKSIVHVIDDNEAVRQALAFQLGSAGIDVRMYESAVAFLEVAPTVHTGCIITDVRMPELSGIDLLRRLRELKHPRAGHRHHRAWRYSARRGGDETWRRRFSRKAFRGRGSTRVRAVGAR